MQFKSILAVLALAVAVIATPIEPAAVTLNPASLVKRTAPQDVCNAQGTNKVATTCTFNNVAISPSDVISLLSKFVVNILNILNLKCVVANNNILIGSGTEVLCCDKSGNSNNQSGNLIAINNQNSCSVQKAI